jgi:predicted permease
MLIALKLALRQFARTPAFTATAVLTLGICLGANLTIYSVVDAILLRSLPFPESGRLVSVFNGYPGAGAPRSGASIPNYFDRRGGAIRAFSSVSVYQGGSLIVGGEGSPARVEVGRVSPEFFATLGVPLAMGHMFSDDNLIYGTDEVAVLTDEFWRVHFGADPNVVGRKFLNDELSVTVIGVLPKGYQFLSSRAQFYRPLSHDKDDRLPKNRHSNNMQMVARLAPGVTLAQAQAQMDAFNEQLLKGDPIAPLVRNAGFHTTVKFLQEDFVRDARPTLVLLQAGALLLLVIGGVNLVDLLLIRATGRTREVAVRQALGAGRRHVVMNVIAETTLLAAAGGLLGLLLGGFGVDLIRVLGADQLPLGSLVSLDGRVVVASAAAVIGVGLMLAGPIVWFHLRSDIGAGLQADSRSGTSSRGANRLRKGFIVAQVALAFVLLSAAGLLGLSLKRVLETPVGFQADSILTGNISLPWKGYKDEASHVAFVERLLPAVRALPGVMQAAVSTGLPFNGLTNDSIVVVEGYKLQPGESLRTHIQSEVAGDYWQAMRIPLLRGRLLDDSDVQAKRRVCVVDEDFAKRYWPGADPLGRRIAPNDIEVTKDNAVTIVGVVASVKQADITESAGHGAVYLPFSFRSLNFLTLAVRSGVPAGVMAPMLRKAVLQLDPNLPIDDLRPMQERIDASLVARRSPAILAGIFAAVALLLAAVGTYGVLSYAVAQRRREIGVRMAIGAQPAQIQGQFLASGLGLTLAGTALGILGAWATGHAMQAVLFGVPALHWGTIVATVAVLGSVAVVACVLPARRAARVDPMVALREE